MSEKKNTSKNPIAYLKHLWKDPITTTAEADARKKEIMPLLIGCIAVFLLMAILSAVIPSLQNVLMIVCMIPGFGAIACGFLLLVIKKAKEKFADLECPNCKKQIQYDNNVRAKVVDKTFTVSKKDKTIEKNGVPHESTITASGKEKVKVEITCKCQECKTEKTFTHDFVTVECEKTAVRIPYVTSGAMLVQFEQDVRNEGAAGFEGKAVGTTPNGVKIKYIRTVEQLVKGYFGNEIQMR